VSCVRCVPPPLPPARVPAGVIRALRPDDYVCSTYRDHVHALSKGVPAREVSGHRPQGQRGGEGGARCQAPAAVGHSVKQQATPCAVSLWIAFEVETHRLNDRCRNNSSWVYKEQPEQKFWLTIPALNCPAVLCCAVLCRAVPPKGDG